ncbi:hypothetical protein BJ987_003200 [Nocardia goodfellowii]|uniref:Uncharacterized protein n=1 Tax=Nocardia goodfellowii TaxID=882446 RepID=A0ABS4QGV5_9NOCA|nr:hypothetical protein [Nocardia goodfellowii]
MQAITALVAAGTVLTTLAMLTGTAMAAGLKDLDDKEA